MITRQVATVEHEYMWRKIRTYRKVIDAIMQKRDYKDAAHAVEKGIMVRTAALLLAHKILRDQ
jgi:hypothetical protein